MSVFKRFSDIVNSNVSAMLDKAENPEKLVRMIIAEMETTLFDVRTQSAKTIADKKDMQRQLKNMAEEVELWQARAEKALNKDREDLARQALQEKRRVEQAIEAQTNELKELDTALMRLEQDISKLQSKLNEAIARRDAIVARHETVKSTIQMRKQIDDSAINEALHRFERFEKRMDELEAEVEAMDLGRNASLSEQIDALGNDEKLDAELAELKARINKKAS
ncbi:phage shock protein PspA [Aliikangiella coralliicola]|uniref:Phage shock protein PspA n=1 Tax=Aliikangiella coralliicola TaxID=2592383 RepID=A0A545TW55_9GAMM|nr:phage shock protein PspA [Aliikangiella coralliicola]TQV81457.1 phage shock protein PspA [Aliikangiella coralliicola]